MIHVVTKPLDNLRTETRTGREYDIGLVSPDEAGIFDSLSKHHNNKVQGQHLQGESLPHQIAPYKLPSKGALRERDVPPLSLSPFLSASMYISQRCPPTRPVMRRGFFRFRNPFGFDISGLPRSPPDARQPRNRTSQHLFCFHIRVLAGATAANCGEFVSPPTLVLVWSFHPWGNSFHWEHGEYGEHEEAVFVRYC
ncbi:hypothetical protein CCMA1212_008928 [Trichoderma ghanense]|uniref:Uncharacterized protein n=1 Tax=Trichoderma ghanense TaxID=65468 RepID=A0ABY2GVG8_9HYPO